MDCGIYKLVCENTHKFYIGSSNDIVNRCNFHIRKLRQNKHSNPKFQNFFNKHKPSIKVILLEKVSVDKLLEVEQRYLDELFKHPLCLNVNPKANKPPTFSGPNHYLYGRQVPKIIVEKQTGKKHWNYGKHLSIETRKKLSLIRKGKKKTEEHKRKISLAKMGQPSPFLNRKHSKVTIRRMSLAKKKYWQRKNL